MDSTQQNAVQSVVEPIIADAQVELVELNVHRYGNRVTVKVLVDKAGGVTILDCAQLNRRLGNAIDEANAITDQYTLEVSSPGLDRPLKTKRDFERALGEELDIDRVEPEGAVRRVSGQLLAVQEDAIVLIVPPETLTIPISSIQRARKTVRIGR